MKNVSDKTKITIAIIIFVIIIVTGIIIYRSGKKSATGPKVTYPDKGEGIPKGWSPEPLVEDLKDAMGGLFTLSGTKDATWQRLIDLPTPDMIVATYDVFNQKYFKEGKGTLTKWMRDEYYYDYTSGIKDKAVKKLTDLKLV